MISPPCPDYTSHCQRFMVSVRLEQMVCLDGTECGVDVGVPVPACCNDIGVIELVKRCGGDLGCIDYYSNSATIFPGFPPDTLSVDSLINMFALGMQGGFLTYLPLFAMSCMILVVILLLNYAISKT